MRERADFVASLSFLFLFLLAPAGATASLQVQDRQPRIVGGKLVYEGEFPYFSSSAGIQLCGATLIWEDCLLTAAHCAKAFESGAIIGAHKHGVIKLDDNNESLSAVSVFRKVTKMVPHPEYENILDGSDVMVLKLEYPVPGVSLARLKTNRPRVVAGDQLVAVGFGKTQHNDTVVDGVLRKADNITAVSWSVCTSEYYGTNAIKHDIQFCAGTTTQRTCGGDSGGPVLDQDGLQVGITSFGVTNCDLHHPRVFTRVSYFADWIQQTVCDISVGPPNYCNSSNNLQATEQRTPAPAEAPTMHPTRTLAPASTITKAPTEKSETPEPTLPPTSASFPAVSKVEPTDDGQPSATTSAPAMIQSTGDASKASTCVVTLCATVLLAAIAIS